MASYLRGLAIVLLVAGVIVCVASVFFAFRDVEYYVAAEALSRHEGNLAFKADYYQAAVPHLAYIVTAIIAGIGGLVSSAILFGLSMVLQRLEHDRARAPLAR